MALIVSKTELSCTASDRKRDRCEQPRLTRIAVTLESTSASQLMLGYFLKNDP